ncbi:hypothetical protein CR513_54634, partial [Mucuna pruriens]
MIEPCEQFKIKHHNPTPYRPKMNRTMGAANKRIKKILSMTCYLMPYTNSEPHWATPYSLAYGTEAVLLVEVEIPTLRVIAKRKPMDPELTTEKRGCRPYVMDNSVKKKEREIENTFDKKARPCLFKEGDLVPKKILPNDKDTKWKCMKSLT